MTRNAGSKQKPPVTNWQGEKGLLTETAVALKLLLFYIGL